MLVSWRVIFGIHGCFIFRRVVSTKNGRKKMERSSDQLDFCWTVLRFFLFWKPQNRRRWRFFLTPANSSIDPRLHLQRVAHLAAQVGVVFPVFPGFPKGCNNGETVKNQSLGIFGDSKVPCLLKKNRKGFERILFEISEKQGRSSGRLKRKAGNDF